MTGQILTFARKSSLVVFAALGVSFASSGYAAIHIVDEFLSPVPAAPVVHEWYETDVRTGGTASVVSLAGMGGNLENNQPLPIGAARLTTIPIPVGGNDKAEVGTFNDYGLATAVLANIDLAYSYYKVAVGATAPAPAIKLGILGPGHGAGNDNYGQLVFEPYLNGPPVPPTGAWQSLVIDENTGDNGSAATEGWWWTGGFNLPNGAGGSPYLSLAQWAGALLAADSEFADARVVSLHVGVGSNNPGQDGYFDAVSYRIGTQTEATVYNFELGGAVPEPMTLLVWSLGSGLALAYARCREK
jgi:hypothetical protein